MPTSGAPIAVLFGTRPEAIKLAPVMLALREAGMPYFTVATGQHPSMVAEVLDLFGIEPDDNLELMRPGQGLNSLLASALELIGAMLDKRRPAAVVVQGDTTSMLGSALAAFHHHLPVAHVEAGLRSNDFRHPFPEEMNRRVASTIARWHFAPTESAAANLRREGVATGVHVVGNTVVDAVRMIDPRTTSLPESLSSFIGDAPYIVATAHRRESWDGGIAAIATALGEVLAAKPELRLIFATHPNPIARRPVDAILGREPRAMVVEALPYQVFLALLAHAQLAVSDSGGVQEEGPTLGVPVLVTRITTERPEGVDAGAVQLIGTDAHRVFAAALALLDDPERMAAMSRAGAGIYGDGTAAHRIVSVLAREAFTT